VEKFAGKEQNVWKITKYGIRNFHTFWENEFPNSLGKCVEISAHLNVFLDGYCSTVQGLLDWYVVNLGFTRLLFIRTDLCDVYIFISAHLNV